MFLPWNCSLDFDESFVIKKNTGTLLDDSKMFGSEVSMKKSKYVFMQYKIVI